MSRRVRTYVAVVALLGAVAVAAAAVHGVGDGFRLGVAVALGGVLAVTHVFPLVILRRDDLEGLQLDEAFVVAMALLLPAGGAILAFAGGIVVGQVGRQLVRRRPTVKTIFNIGQFLTAGAAGIAVAHVLSGFETIGPRELLAVIAGAAVFFVVNSTAVSGVLALAAGMPLRHALTDEVDVRLLVWAGNVSLGVLAGLLGTAYLWALPFAIGPLAVLHASFQGTMRARRDRTRMAGLFRATTEAHGSIGLDDVERALVRSAADLLQCRDVRLATVPTAAADELAARVPSATAGVERWLIVGGRLGGQQFDDADRGLLDGIAAIGGTALDNAALHERVEDERAKVTGIVEASSDGIFSIDADGRVQSWNPAMESMTGYPAVVAIGKTCETVFGPCDDLTASGDVPVGITTRRGEARWVTCTRSPMAEGGSVIVARDVTAQKEVDDLKADFLGTVSHELRTPLTPIIGFLQTLLREDATFSPEDRRRFYDLMLKQSERLQRLVNDLLDATSLNDRDHLFLPEELDWSASARRVVDLFRGQHPDRRFELAIDDDLPVVVADEQRAEQVLTNLLGNAVKYTPDGEAVTVTVAASPEGVVVTTVSDQGPGIPALERDRVFERFTRLGHHLTRRVGGAGLGLFISRRLVEGMGGTISVDEAPGGGAAFTFTLPVHVPAETGTPAP